MSSLSAIRAANTAAFSHSYRPVALFVGGTSGIGRATAEAFARYTEGNAHIVICGRNRDAAQSIIASFPESDSSLYEFVECDVTLMKNVQATTTHLLSTLPKLNFLVASTGFLNLKGRDETSEGIDKKLAVDYYSRWKFINSLMPLLRKAKDAGEDAKVISILGAGNGGVIDLDNLGLKMNYSLQNVMEAAVTYSDLMIESYAAQQPDMAFTHMFPGLVRTNIIKPESMFLKPFWPLLQGIMYFMSLSAADSAEYILHALLVGENGSFRRGPNAQALGTGKGYFSTEEAKAKLWEHTLQVTSAA